MLRIRKLCDDWDLCNGEDIDGTLAPCGTLKPGNGECFRGHNILGAVSM